MKQQDPALFDFYWQGGYAIFSVGRTELGMIREYILKQEELHKSVSFQDELRALLNEHGVEYDERYVWD